jgi:hypothetical protein
MLQSLRRAGKVVAAGGVLLLLALPAAAQVPKAPAWSYGLDLKCRTSNQTTFELARIFALDVYRDDNHGKGLYITEMGVLASARGFEHPKGPPRPPTWLHKLDLKARPANVEGFRRVGALGLEVFRDEVNRHWLYVTETGGFAVVPAARRAAGGVAAKGAVWLHGLDLKVRKGGQNVWDKNTPVWGIEVYLDQNTGNLIYLCQNGMLAAVPHFQEVPAPTPVGRAPEWLAGLDVQVHHGGQPRRLRRFLTYGVEVYRDENNGNLIWISETGSLAVVPGKKALPTATAKPWQAEGGQLLDVKCNAVKQKQLTTLVFGVTAFSERNSGCLVYLSATGALAAVPK